MLTNVQYEVLREQLDRKLYGISFSDVEMKKAYEDAMMEAKSIVKSVGLLNTEVLLPEQECSEIIGWLQVKAARVKNMDESQEYMKYYCEAIYEATSVVELFYTRWRSCI